MKLMKAEVLVFSLWSHTPADGASDHLRDGFSALWERHPRSSSMQPHRGAQEPQTKAGDDALRIPRLLWTKTWPCATTMMSRPLTSISSSLMGSCVGWGEEEPAKDKLRRFLREHKDSGCAGKTLRSKSSREMKASRTSVINHCVYSKSYLVPRDPPCLWSVQSFDESN